MEAMKEELKQGTMDVSKGWRMEARDEGWKKEGRREYLYTRPWCLQLALTHLAYSRNNDYAPSIP